MELTKIKLPVIVYCPIEIISTIRNFDHLTYNILNSANVCLKVLQEHFLNLKSQLSRQNLGRRPGGRLVSNDISVSFHETS